MKHVSSTWVSGCIQIVVSVLDVELLELWNSG